MIPSEHDPGGLFSGLAAPLVAVEVLPPAAADQAGFLASARQLKDLALQPAFLPDSPQGQPRAASLATAQVLAGQGQRCVPHLGGRDRNRVAVVAAIQGAALAGLSGIKAVSGDPVDPLAGRGVFELDSAQIVSLIAEWNRTARAEGQRCLTPIVGHTLGEEDPAGADGRLRRKLQSGARVVVSTPTLDPDLAAAFVSSLEGQDLSLVLGLTLVAAVGVLDYLLAEVPTFRVPERVQNDLQAASSARDAEQVGLAAALDVARAVKGRVAGFQLVPLFGKLGSLGTFARALRAEISD